jgi:hypothetical protein
MNVLQIAVVVMCVYWLVLQIRGIRYIGVPRSEFSALWYMRVGLGNLLEVLLFWALLHTGAELPIIAAVLLWCGVVQAALSVMVIPMTPEAIKKKPVKLTQGSWNFSLVTYCAMAFAAVYTAFLT